MISSKAIVAEMALADLRAEAAAARLARRASSARRSRIAGAFANAIARTLPGRSSDAAVPALRDYPYTARG